VLMWWYYVRQLPCPRRREWEVAGRWWWSKLFFRFVTNCNKDGDRVEGWWVKFLSTLWQTVRCGRWEGSGWWFKIFFHFVKPGKWSFTLVTCRVH
jgi:hypothetical protein